MSIELPPPEVLKQIKRGKVTQSNKDELDLLSTCMFWGLMGYEL